MRRRLLDVVFVLAVISGCAGAAPEAAVGAKPSEVLEASVATAPATAAPSAPAQAPRERKPLEDEDPRLLLMLGVEPGKNAGVTSSGGGLASGGGLVLGGGRQPPKIEVGIAQMSAALPSDVIHRVVRRSFPQFRRCYEGGLRRDPKLAGKVVVRFAIGTTGAVTSTSSTGSQLRDPAVVACFVSAFQAMAFPAPVKSVAVTYPLLLEPGDAPAPATPTP